MLEYNMKLIACQFDIAIDDVVAKKSIGICKTKLHMPIIIHSLFIVAIKLVGIHLYSWLKKDQVK